MYGRVEVQTYKTFISALAGKKKMVNFHDKQLYPSGNNYW
jgi:hypothetical protein